MGTVSSGELASESTENILEITHIRMLADENRRLLGIPPHIPSAYIHIDVNYCQQKGFTPKTARTQQEHTPGPTEQTSPVTILPHIPTQNHEQADCVIRSLD
jgi:hypothetical protein